MQLIITPVSDTPITLRCACGALLQEDFARQRFVCRGCMSSLTLGEMQGMLRSAQSAIKGLSALIGEETRCARRS